MSAEKGGALVRSPPGLVESYTTHVGGSAKWGEASPAPHLPPQKQQQPQRNATVTKISSGGYKGSGVTLLDTKKKPESNNDTDNECRCDGWARARQLEHDLDQLKRTHDVILKGLHSQLEEMKQKNRDLTFQLLMGPFANAVQIDVPLSPESDVTPPKEDALKDRVSIPNSTITPSELGSKTRSAPSNDIMPKEFSHRQPKGKTGDPRLARSLDLEILEEEADEMRTQLEDERAKNKYLLALTEDLKRQIREETGSWYPQLLTQKKGSVPIPYKPIHDARKPLVTEHGVNSNAFRLPQIAYQTQRVQPLDQEQQPQHSHKPPHLHHRHVPHHLPQKEDSTQDSPRKKQTSKLHERNKDLSMSTTLPAIVRTGESQQRRKSDGQVKLEGETSNRHGTEEPSHPSRGKHHPKGKTKHRQYPNDSSPSIQENREYSQREFGEGSNSRQKHSYREHRQQKSQNKNKGTEQDNPQAQSEQQLKHSDKQRHHQDSRKSVGENSQHPNSPKKHRTGSATRVRPASQGRSSEREKRVQTPSKSHNKSTPSTSKNSKASVHINGADHGSTSLDDGTTKQIKHAGSKSSQNLHEESSSSFDLVSMNMSSDGGMASSSTSNSRIKHRGRANKRGGKKNKKELQDSREEFKDH